MNEHPRKDEGGAYAVVVEGGTQGPILMENEGPFTTREHAQRHLHRLLAQGQWFRGCVVRLEYVAGNEAVMQALEAMQRDPDEISLSF